MSEQVPVSKLHDWIRKSLSSELTQAEREREKILSELSRAFESLSQMCGQLTQKAERDMEKRENRAEYRAAKAVVRLTEVVSGMCSAVTSPSSKDTVTLRNLQRQLSKIASDAAAARQEWLRQIRPYYIIDMMTLGGQIDKVKRLGEELHTFLVGKGSLLRSLEELNEKLSSLSKLELSKESTSTQRQALERRLEEARQQEQKLRNEVQTIRENPRMKEYFAVDQELRAHRGELVRTGFSRLGGPLRKLISISERGNYPLPIDVREKAKEYANKPFTTFLREEDGYPHLKAVLTALSNAVSSSKLALKQREAKKVLERTQQAVEGGFLMGLQTKSKNLKRTYDQLVADPETAALVQRLRELRERGRVTHAAQVELRDELQRTRDVEGKLEEQIALQLKTIEGFVKEIAGTSPKLALT